MRIIACLLLMLLILGCGGKVMPINSTSEVQRGTREAARDARKDVSKTTWFGCGLVGGCLPLAAVIASDHYATRDDTLFYLSLLGLPGPTCAALLHIPAVPPERLLGKSTDYVNAYMRVYRRDVKRQRIKYAASGGVTGCVISFIALLGVALEGLEAL